MQFPIERAIAMRFAEEWIAAWNAHDLERILSHYDDDFKMASPRIIEIAGEPKGKLRGKVAIGGYWKRGLELLPDLHFELLEVFASIDTICIYYHSSRAGKAVEWFEFGADGKVIRSAGHYIK